MDLDALLFRALRALPLSPGEAQRVLAQARLRGVTLADALQDRKRTDWPEAAEELLRYAFCDGYRHACRTYRGREPISTTRIVPRKF